MHGYHKSNRPPVFNVEQSIGHVQEAQKERLQKNTTEGVQAALWGLPKNFWKIVVGSWKKDLPWKAQNQRWAYERDGKGNPKLWEDSEVRLGRKCKFESWRDAEPKNKRNFN